jgi:hypothetical protein
MILWLVDTHADMHHAFCTYRTDRQDSILLNYLPVAVSAYLKLMMQISTYRLSNIYVYQSRYPRDYRSRLPWNLRSSAGWRRFLPRGISWTSFTRKQHQMPLSCTYNIQDAFRYNNWSISSLISCLFVWQELIHISYLTYLSLPAGVWRPMEMRLRLWSVELPRRCFVSVWLLLLFLVTSRSPGCYQWKPVKTRWKNENQRWPQLVLS